MLCSVGWVLNPGLNYVRFMSKKIKLKRKQNMKHTKII